MPASLSLTQHVFPLNLPMILFSQGPRWLCDQWDYALNRFLIYTGYYIVFVWLLYYTFIWEEDTNEFCWTHMVLLVFAASMMGTALKRYVHILDMIDKLHSFVDNHDKSLHACLWIDSQQPGAGKGMFGSFMICYSTLYSLL